ncbi:hypothetical protein EXIGLDRAFT_833427 [Exidia glandulosa HHB12029]|uniref:Uncharacterized protein n=1 Tax=Exidia glandulosa HHB12029 TaxID=1314781 RepID=A0A166B059_EXIGL|nr:hypothetical protein EXIGLDRAFT_833427 [Exidia glandulosa HHB12029]
MSFNHQPQYNRHQNDPGVHHIYMSGHGPVQPAQPDVDPQGIPSWLRGLQPNPYFLQGGGGASTNATRGMTISSTERELAGQYTQQGMTWPQNAANVQHVQPGLPSLTPPPSNPPSRGAAPTSPAMAPWSPSAPQFFGSNANAFAPSPSPPPQAQAWLGPQPHPQPQPAVGPGVVYGHNHVQYAAMQYRHTQQPAYGYAYPSVGTYGYAYMPVVLMANNTGQPLASLPPGPQQLHSGHAHDDGNGFAMPQAVDSAAQQMNLQYPQAAARAIQGVPQLHFSGLRQGSTNYDVGHFSLPGSSSTAGHQTSSSSLQGATATNQVTETETSLSSNKATTPPGTVDPKWVFMDPNATDVSVAAASTSATVPDRQQAVADAQPVEYPVAVESSQAQDEDEDDEDDVSVYSSSASDDEYSTPVSNSLEARVHIRNKSNPSNRLPPAPSRPLVETITADYTPCTWCGHLIETPFRTDTRTGRRRRRGDKFTCHHFALERHTRCGKFAVLKVKLVKKKGKPSKITNVAKLGVWLLKTYPQLAVTKPRPFKYMQLGKVATRELRAWWDGLAKAKRSRWIRKAEYK